MSVVDDGRGMSEEMLREVTDPFTTTRTTRKVGLGIPLLKAAAEACNGHLEIASELGAGTTLSVQFQRSHLDRMPVGDIVTTLLNLIVSNPQVNWIFDYRYNGAISLFNDAPIKKELGDIPLSEPEVLSCVRGMIESTLTELNPAYSQDTVTILT